MKKFELVTKFQFLNKKKISCKHQENVNYLIVKEKKLKNLPKYKGENIKGS